MKEERFLQALEQGDHDLASEMLSRLKDEMPRSRFIYLQGLLLIEKGEREEGLNQFDRALVLNLSDMDIWLAKAKVLLDLGRLDLARRAADRACRLSIDDPAPHLLCADVLYRMREYNDALSQVESALSIDPRSPKALTLKGILVSIIEQDYVKALSFFDAAIEVDEGYGMAWTNRGTVLREIGDRDGALYSFQRALLIDRGDRVARKMMLTMGGESYLRYVDQKKEVSPKGKGLKWMDRPKKRKGEHATVETVPPSPRTIGEQGTKGAGKALGSKPMTTDGVTEENEVEEFAPFDDSDEEAELDQTKDVRVEDWEEKGKEEEDDDHEEGADEGGQDGREEVNEEKEGAENKGEENAWEEEKGGEEVVVEGKEEEGEEEEERPRVEREIPNKLDLECPRCGDSFSIRVRGHTKFKCPGCGLKGEVD